MDKIIELLDESDPSYKLGLDSDSLIFNVLKFFMTFLVVLVIKINIYYYQKILIRLNIIKGS